MYSNFVMHLSHNNVGSVLNKSAEFNYNCPIYSSFAFEISYKTIDHIPEMLTCQINIHYAAVNTHACNN